MDGIVAGPDGGEKLARGPRNHRILAELPELEVIELCFGPDFEGVEPHTHADQVDSFYVLEGEAEFIVGERDRPRRPGHVRRRAGRRRPRLPERRRRASCAC